VATSTNSGFSTRGLGSVGGAKRGRRKGREKHIIWVWLEIEYMAVDCRCGLCPSKLFQKVGCYGDFDFNIEVAIYLSLIVLPYACTILTCEVHSRLITCTRSLSINSFREESN